MARLAFAAPGVPRKRTSALFEMAASDGGGSSGGGNTGGGSSPSYALPGAISGLAGWWDGGSLTGLGVGAWNSPVSTISDQSGAGAALAVTGAPNSQLLSTGAIAVPHLCKGLGGVWARLDYNANYYTRPAIDVGVKYTVPNVRLDAGAAWTLYLVWTRPGLAQSAAASSWATRIITGPLPLVQLGSTVVAAIGNTGSADALTVFGASLAAGLAVHHTHSLTLTNTPGVGVDVWLDDTKLNSSPVANTLSATTPATLYFFGNSTSAQCAFHEAALWGRALGAGDLATLLTSANSVSKRWTRGQRASGSIMLMGQSNAADWGGDGGIVTMSEMVRYYLGLVSFTVLKAGATGGLGVYATNANALQYWLDYPGNTDPSTWNAGTMGQALQAYISGMTPDVLADVAGFYIHWSEADSGPYCLYGQTAALGYEAAQTQYQAAIKRMLSLARGWADKSAAQMPAFWIRGLSYPGTSTGPQLERVAVETAAADASANINVVLKQSSDALPRGATYNADGSWAPAGSEVGAHMDAIDNVTFAKRASLDIAVVLRRQGVCIDAATSPASVPATGVQKQGGPQVIAAHYEGVTYAPTGTVLVTVEHDAGGDLKLALEALNGWGWAVMDGGSLATTPGAIVYCQAAARVDATHVRLTLDAVLNNAGSATLYYPFSGQPTTPGEGLIGRGDAVTDNYSSISKPAGWDAGTDSGPAWNIDWPLWIDAAGVAIQ